MIGKIMPHTKTFGQRTSYAQYAKDCITPRDEWTVLRNLDGIDADLAHVVMNATAKQSRRVQKPCGHLILSWAEADQPSPETMLAIADQTMADLGLTEHQSMYVAHDDTDHKHLHIVYNRVHPETFKAAKDSFSRLTLRKSLMRQEQEHALQQTPYLSRGRHERPLFAEIEIAKRENREASVRMSKQRCDRLKDELAYCFDNAFGWSSFHDMLKRRGYDLSKAGAGIRVTRNFSYAKFSDVLPPKLKAKQLTQRWGKFADYWQQYEPVKRKQRRKRKQRAVEKQL